MIRRPNTTRPRIHGVAAQCGNQCVTDNSISPIGNYVIICFGFARVAFGAFATEIELMRDVIGKILVAITLRLVKYDDARQGLDRNAFKHRQARSIHLLRTVSFII